MHFRTRLFPLAALIDVLIITPPPFPQGQRQHIMSKTSPQTDEPSFEDALQRLDEIVAGMEEGQLSLESMIASYEEGVSLLKLCRNRIDGARRRVELISGDLEGGKASLTSFEAPQGDEDTAEFTEKSRHQPRRRKPADAEGGEIRLF